MDRATFNELVGGIVGNLLSLEFLMRFLLVQTESPIEPMPVFDELKAGDHVAEGTFTNYESLGDVIARTNAYLEAHGIGERVDPSIVGIRDALAHGRKVFADKNGPATLVKFGRPRHGTVLVQAVFTLTEDELRLLTERIYGEIKKVIAAGQALNPAAFAD